MHSVMHGVNLYKVQKEDTSDPVVCHGFGKTVVHIIFLLIAIVVMAVYYARLTITRREVLRVDGAKNEYIPYSDYEPLYEEFELLGDTAVSCDCAGTFLSWNSIINEVEVEDDRSCGAMYIAYNACYADVLCREGFVGEVIFYYFAELCGKVEQLYPSPDTIPPFPFATSTLMSIDAWASFVFATETRWQNNIKAPFKTTYLMTYPWLNNDTAAFASWAQATTYGEISSAEYWEDNFGLFNSSFGIADGFAQSLWETATESEEEGRLIVESIEDAFLYNGIYILADYEGSDSDDATGYYERCAPYQCVWFITEQRSFLEIVVIVTGLLGGIHAALFVIVNGFDTVYHKVLGKTHPEDASEEPDNKVEMEYRITPRKESGSGGQPETEIAESAPLTTEEHESARQPEVGITVS